MAIFRSNSAPEDARQALSRSGAALLGVGVGIAAAAATFQNVTRARRKIALGGRTIVITGGSRGLGLILACKLASAGGRVCIIARDSDELARAREIILRSSLAVPDDIHVIVCDVGKREEIQAAIEAAADAFEAEIDILINNAGIIQVGPMEAMTDSDYDEAMRTHFWAPYYATQAVLPGMRLRKSGRIVNIASIGGKISVPHLLPYSASKFALVGLSEGLRSELMKDNILVTTVCPGLIRTGSPRNALFRGKHRDEYAWFALSDSLPGLSMSADRCADQIITALRFGDAEIVTSAVAQIGALVHGVFPSLVTDVLGLVNRLLPVNGDGPNLRFTGAESESEMTRTPLMALTRRAETAHNQL